MFLGSWLRNHEVRQYLAAFTWNFGALNLGVYLGWASVTGPKLQSETSPVLNRPVTDEELSYSTSLPFLVAICFAMVWGYIANTLGRKITGYLNALCYIVCFALILKTSSVHVFIMSRVIGGIAYCPVLFNGPMYIAEIAEVSKIGRLSSTYLISENFGTVLVYVLGSYCSYYVLNVVCLACAGVFLVLITIFPESPVFYLKSDRPKEAKIALQWFRPKNNEVYLETEIQRLNDTFILSKNMKFKYLFTKHTLMALFIAMAMQLGVQFSGINYVTMYTVDILKRSAGLVDPYTGTMIAGVAHTLAPCLYFMIINSFGRKTITIFSYTSLALIWAILGGYHYYIDHSVVDVSSTINYLPVICVTLYFLFYSSGAGSIPFTIYSEIFSSEVRNTVVPFIYVWNGLASFFLLKFAPTFLMQTIHMSGVFWFISISCLLTSCFTIIFIPETKGKPFLTIIDELTKKAWWK